MGVPDRIRTDAEIRSGVRSSSTFSKPRSVVPWRGAVIEGRDGISAIAIASEHKNGVRRSGDVVDRKINESVVAIRGVRNAGWCSSIRKAGPTIWESGDDSPTSPLLIYIGLSMILGLWMV